MSIAKTWSNIRSTQTQAQINSHWIQRLGPINFKPSPIVKFCLSVLSLINLQGKMRTFTLIWPILKFYDIHAKMLSQVCLILGKSFASCLQTVWQSVNILRKSRWLSILMNNDHAVNIIHAQKHKDYCHVRISCSCQLIAILLV